MCACMCVCLCAKPLASLGAAVLGRVFGGLLVSLKALDNKDHFFFSWETKPSLPGGRLSPSPSLPHSPLPCPAVLSPPLPPSECFLSTLFFFSSEIVLSFFESSNHLLHRFFCFPFIFLCLEIQSPLLSLSPPFLSSSTSPPPHTKHTGLGSLELPSHQPISDFHLSRKKPRCLSFSVLGAGR